MRFVALFLVVASLASATLSAFASERPMDLAREQAIKTALLQQLSAQIERHEAMSAEEIRADLAQSLESRRAILNAQGFQALSNQVAAMQSLDKETLIAAEKAHLQEALSSDLIVGLFTFMAYYSASESGSDASAVGFFIALPFTIALDIITLPLQLIYGLTLTE